MKKALLVLMMAAMVLSFAACGNQNTDTQPDSTDKEGQHTQQTQPAQAQVSDAFSDTVEGCCFHIPKISLGDISVEQTNAHIYEELYHLVQEGVYHCLDDGYSIWYTGMVYQWLQVGQVLSVVVQVESAGNDFIDYYVYNISAVNGQLLSDGQLYEALNMTKGAGDQILFEACEQYWDTYAAEHGDTEDPEFLKELRDQTLADENLAQAKPYANQDGAVGYVVNIYAVAGPPYYTYRIERNGVLPEIQCKEHPAQ